MLDDRAAKAESAEVEILSNAKSTRNHVLLSLPHLSVLA